MEEIELPPSPFEPRRRHVLWWIAAILVTAGLLVAALTVPVPGVFAYLPGPVRDVEGLVSVEGAQTYSSEGRLYLTTVSVDTEVTVADIGRALVDPARVIVQEQSVTGGQSLEDLRQEQRAEMRNSKQAAIEVVAAALGLGRPEGDGARVEAILPGSPAEGLFVPGDLILRVDGRRVHTTCEVGSAIATHEVGDEIRVTVRRAGRSRTLKLKTVPNPQDVSQSIVGIAMSDVDRRFEPGVKVRFRTGNIAGPSAGLMFSLALYDQLTPEDLTAGRAIAGTGTIECDGGVGPIGGIEQKIAAAEREGAEVFLSPAANFEAASRAASDIEVVSISTFDDAVRYLEELN